MWRLAVMLHVCLGSWGDLSIQAFAPSAGGRSTVHKQSRVTLHMAKKLRSKQADLAAKLAAAKKQNAKKEGDEEQAARMTDKEIKEQNDRKRFGDMLKRQSSTSLISDGYLTEEQEEAQMDAFERGLALLYEGDNAPTEPFQNLVTPSSGTPLGSLGAERLVPWLKSFGSDDYLVVLADPRIKSFQFREAAKSASTELSKSILDKMLFINSDTPAENRRWMKKTGLNSLKVYCDEKREWMEAYTALGEKRFSLTVFVLAKERVQKVARDVETMSLVQTVENAVSSMKRDML